MGAHNSKQPNSCKTDAVESQKYINKSFSDDKKIKLWMEWLKKIIKCEAKKGNLNYVLDYLYDGSPLNTYVDTMFNSPEWIYFETQSQKEYNIVMIKKSKSCCVWTWEESSKGFGKKLLELSKDTIKKREKQKQTNSVSVTL